jgi:hypothetical protein
MSKPIDNEAAPVVSTLLRQGWLPDESEALELIDQSESRVKADALWSLAATGVSLASACGMLAVATIQAPIVIPVIGAMGCLMTAWNSRQTEIDRMREAEFLSEFPEVLKLIESKVDGSNDERVATAYDRTFKAWRYGELDHVGRFLDGAAPSVALKDIPIDDSPIPETPMNAESGEFPSLNGDNAKSKTIATTAIQPPMQDQDAPTQGTPGFIAEMTYPVKSGMIVGLPGAGKDLVAAIVLNRIADQNPDLQIFITDPKNSPKESGYYARYNPANVDRFKSKGMSEFEIQERMEAMYSRVVNAGEKTLWAINEFATLVGLVNDKWVKGFNAKLQTIVQMGDSEENYLWLISQTGNLSELKLPSSLRGTLARNFLAIAQPGYEAALAGLTRTDLITNHDDARMRVMWGRSPVKRAYYYSTLNRWESMPKLQNLSGYDRDSRKWMDGHTPSEPVSKPTEFPVAAVSRAVGERSFKTMDSHPVTPKPRPILKPKPTDPAQDVIDHQPDGNHKAGLQKAYQWHKNRRRKGKGSSLEDFKKAVERKDSGLSFILDPEAIYSDLKKLIS